MEFPLWLPFFTYSSALGRPKRRFYRQKNTQHFTFAQKMTKELGEHVDLWATLNEPTAYILKSYIQGDWCPGKKRSKRNSFSL